MRVGSLWTRSLTPPSLYSLTSISAARPVHSRKRPMFTPGRSTWKRSSPTGSGRVGSVATEPEPEVERFSWVVGGGTVRPRASRFVEQLAQLLLFDHQLALQAVVELLELLVRRAGV